MACADISSCVLLGRPCAPLYGFALVLDSTVFGAGLNVSALSVVATPSSQVRKQGGGAGRHGRASRLHSPSPVAL